jgi:hypothetical protein
MHGTAMEIILVVFMTAYHHSIYCDLIHNEDATNQNKKQYTCISILAANT